MKRSNYHTHTVYCHHANNTIEEMILKAIEENFENIGFSEHTPLKPTRRFRLNLNEYETYLNEGHQLKLKYQDKINVYLGFECEYHQDEYEFFKKIKDHPYCDYLILGNHNLCNPHQCLDITYERCDLDQYYEQLKQASESGLFRMLAHPDYIFRYYNKWDEKAEMIAKKIIDVAIKHDLALGFNLKGLSICDTEFCYPTYHFWKLIKNTKAKLIIEADAHDKKYLEMSYWQKAYDLIDKWDLRANLIHSLNI